MSNFEIVAREDYSDVTYMLEIDRKSTRLNSSHTR